MHQPKHNTNKSKPKANATGASAETKPSNKSDDKNKSEIKKIKTNLVHDGISSPNIYSWIRMMKNPELYTGLKFNWASSLFDSMEESKIKLPILVGGEPVRPKEIVTLKELTITGVLIAV